MGLLEVDSIPRRTMVLFFIVDASTSMEGNKIGAVNDAIRNVLPMIHEISNDNPEAEIKVAVLQFANGATWLYDKPLLADDFIWQDIVADGLTPMGEALTELNKKLAKDEFMKSASGSYAPAFILMSDGQPTDNYEHGLNVLLKNKWFTSGIRTAIAIGADADRDILAQFTGNSEGVYEVNNIEALKNVIRLIAVTSSTIGSQASNSSKKKQDQVIEEVKKQIEDDESGIQKGTNSDGSTDSEDDDWA